MRGPREQLESLWIGWPGDVSRFDADRLGQLEKHLITARLPVPTGKNVIRTVKVERGSFITYSEVMWLVQR